jgi:hypothetical protein
VSKDLIPATARSGGMLLLNDGKTIGKTRNQLAERQMKFGPARYTELEFAVEPHAKDAKGAQRMKDGVMLRSPGR